MTNNRGEYRVTLSIIIKGCEIDAIDYKHDIENYARNKRYVDVLEVDSDIDYYTL